MKIAVNLPKGFSEIHYQTNYLLKVRKFSTNPPQNDRPVDFFVKSKGNHLLISDIWLIDSA